MRAGAVVTILLTMSFLAGCGDQGPGAGPGQASGATGHPSGVTGVVRLGPRCPVETGAQGCQDQPAADATVTVTQQRPISSTVHPAGHRVVARARTDADGGYRIALRPGTYVVTADAGRSCRLTSVRITAGAYAKLDLVCDTGIR